MDGLVQLYQSAVVKRELSVDLLVQLHHLQLRARVSHRQSDIADTSGGNAASLELRFRGRTRHLILHIERSHLS